MECPGQNRETAVESAARECCDRRGTLWSALDDWRVPPVSGDFDRRLYARIEQEGNTGWFSRLLRPAGGMRWQQAFSLSTACLVIIAVLLINAPTAPPVRSAPKAESVDIEQVERTLDDMEMLQQLNPVAKAEKPATGESL